MDSNNVSNRCRVVEPLSKSILGSSRHRDCLDIIARVSRHLNRSRESREGERKNSGRKNEEQLRRLNRSRSHLRQYLSTISYNILRCESVENISRLLRYSEKMNEKLTSISISRSNPVSPAVPSLHIGEICSLLLLEWVGQRELERMKPCWKNVRARRRAPLLQLLQTSLEQPSCGEDHFIDNSKRVCGREQK